MGGAMGGAMGGGMPMPMMGGKPPGGRPPSAAPPMAMPGMGARPPGPNPMEKKSTLPAMTPSQKEEVSTRSAKTTQKNFGTQTFFFFLD